MKKRLPIFEILLIIAILGIHTYAALSDTQNFPNRWFTRDDSYYYFKVAQNITEGHGITFDGVNRANGYHPLWMLVCIPIFALARFDLVLPLRVLLLVMAALNAATAVLLYKIIDRSLSKPVGILAAAFWAFNPYIFATVTQYGLETALATFAVAFFIYRLQQFEINWRQQPATRKEITLLAVAALLPLFSRLDLVFLVAVAGVWLVFRGTPLRYYLPFDLLIVAVSVFTSFAARLDLPEYYAYSNSAVVMTILTVLTTIPALYIAGLYQRPGAWSPLKVTGRAALAVTAAFAASSVIMLAASYTPLLDGFPRSALPMSWLICLILIVASRLGVLLFHTKKQPVDAVIPVQQFMDNWKTWLSEGLTYYGIFGGALAAYMLFNKLTFGTWSPVSGQIKRWWGSLPGKVYGGSPRSILAFLGLEPGGDFNAWAPASTSLRDWADWLRSVTGSAQYDRSYVTILVLVSLAGLGILLLNRRRSARASITMAMFPLLAGIGFQVLSYTALGYAAAKEWYWTAELIFMVLAISLLLNQVISPLWRNQPNGRPILLAAVGLVSLSMAWSFLQRIDHLMPYNVSQPGDPYMDVLPLLEGRTESGSIIGMTGGGNIGYFIHDRTIVNMDGLINSTAYFQALKSGQAGDYLAQMGMDYIFANPDLLEGLPYKGQFTGRYETSEAVYGNKQIMPFMHSP